MSKTLITLWEGPLTARVGNVENFVKKNKTMLNELSPKRDWVAWIKSQKKKPKVPAIRVVKGTKKSIDLKPTTKGIGGKPPSKKRIETGTLMKGKVNVPDQAPKGEIKQKEKNLTAYGKEANKEEADTILKAAVKKDWTIVSDNCYGVAYMKALGEPYDSPFFSMYILAPDYLILLENFDEYMKITPVGQSPEGKTNYYKSKKHPEGLARKYPVLLLKGKQGNVEIHFAHEKQGAKEAIRKWTTRTARMDMDKKDMFVKMDSRDQFSKMLGRRFLALKQFPHKKLFVADKYRKDFEGDKNVIIMGDFKTQPPIGTKTEKLYPVPSK